MKKNLQITIPGDKPILCTVSGSFFRRGADPLISGGTIPLEDYVKATDFRTSIDPCILYPEYDGIYTPHAYDVPVSYEWKPTNVIAHSPSDRKKKGTQELIEAVEALKKDGYDIELDIIEGVSYLESIARKKNALLFYDQSLTGFYGNASIEAMALGVPTMCRMDEKAYARSGGKLDNCPVLDTKEGLKEAIASYLDRKDKASLSEKTARFVKKTHSYESVSVMWDIIYKTLLNDK